jgi:hypothetical protein
VTLAIVLLTVSVLAPVLAGRLGRRPVLWSTAVLVGAGLVHDAFPLVDLAPLGRMVGRLEVLGGDGPAVLLLVAALAWCGPAADLLVRRALDATGVVAPTPGASGERAGRWIGRLERWLLVLCIAGGQPALAVIPVGGKALFRYAEVVADARAERPRLERAGGDDPPVARDTLVDYVIVGSLASWTQAIALGLLIGAS